MSEQVLVECDGLVMTLTDGRFWHVPAVRTIVAGRRQ
jgi:hypothetical protein